MLLQATWWASGQIKWLKHPVILPIVVAAIVATGMTPEYVYMQLKWLAPKAFSSAVQLVIGFSASWLLDYWFVTCLLVVLGTQWVLRKWWNRLRRSPPSTKSTTPSTTPDTVSETSSKHSEGESRRPPQKCQISLILRNGDPNTPMSNKTCVKDAHFILPMGGGDKLRTGVQNGTLQTATHNSACALCSDHLETYQRHMVACACKNMGCSNMGIPFPTHKGLVYECKTHPRTGATGRTDYRAL